MGYVYLIGTNVFWWYKIGKSVSPEVRVRDIGILLPFKIEVMAIWKASDHHAMEKALHEMYAANRINGEWFHFKKKEVQDLIDSIPAEVLVSKKLDMFSNIAEDRIDDRRIIGVRREKLRGNFTPEEREQKRINGMAAKRLKKQLRDSGGET
jgi:hypothetical protein